MKRLAMILAGLIGVAAAPATAADCDFSVQRVSQAITPYEPFVATDTIVDLELRVTNNSDGKCAASLYVDPVNGARTLLGGGANLTYRFNDLPAPGRGTGPYPVELLARESTIVRVRMLVPKQQIVPRADYVADLLARVEPAGAGTATLSGGGFPVVVQVQGRVEMSISGAPSTNLSSASMAPASINLGTLYEGQTGRVYVNIWSNGSVSVSLSSANKGELVRDDELAGPGVPYSATFDGEPVTFPKSVVRSPPLSIIGGAYQLGIKIGSLKGVFAGRYTDVVTVDVRQN